MIIAVRLISQIYMGPLHTVLFHTHFWWFSMPFFSLKMYWILIKRQTVGIFIGVYPTFLHYFIDKTVMKKVIRLNWFIQYFVHNTTSRYSLDTVQMKNPYIIGYTIRNQLVVFVTITFKDKGKYLFETTFC